MFSVQMQRLGFIAFFVSEVMSEGGSSDRPSQRLNVTPSPPVIPESVFL